jgi:hypothetical protein
LFVSFLFFFSLLLLYVGVVNALVKGEIEDHVWFEDRWMVTSRETSAKNKRESIAGAGCGLTGIGAGEEQARKVFVGEACKCGEDKKASFEGPGGQRGKVRAA